MIKLSSQSKVQTRLEEETKNQQTKTRSKTKGLKF